MPKGKLITLEGIDGTGKSSIAKMLKNKFPDAVFTAEPTHGWTGEAVRTAIKKDVDPLAELFLFMADHAEHIASVVKPALDSGKLVISDRYSDSRCAYQGALLAGFDDPVAWVKELHSWSIKPDLTILFTVEPGVAIKRCSRRGSKTKFEQPGFLERVQSNFQRLAREEPERFVVIDAGKPLEDVEKLAAEAIHAMIR